MSSIVLTKVLVVPELLENIIFALPDRDIYNNAQRVSRVWKASIDASPRLLRKSWQRGSKSPKISPSRFALGPEHDDDDIVSSEIDVPIYFSPVVVNSHFTNGNRLLTDVGVSSGSLHNSFASPQFTVCYLTVTKRKILDMPGERRGSADQQSWRSMQICDPPITVAKMNVSTTETTTEDDHMDVELLVYDRGGITMGLVYETGVAAIRSGRNIALPLNRWDYWSFDVSFWFEEDNGESPREKWRRERGLGVFKSENDGWDLGSEDSASSDEWSINGHGGDQDGEEDDEEEADQGTPSENDDEDREDNDGISSKNTEEDREDDVGEVGDPGFRRC